jgi:teichoic acid transport system permease protein
LAVTDPSALRLTRREEPGSYLAELWRRRHFAWHVAMGGMRARTSSSVLGLLWWMLDPLILGGVFLLVFGVILNTRRGDPNYLGFLLSGLFAFTYTRTTMMSGGNTLTANAHLIATQRFPRLLLPLAAVIQGGVAFLASLVPFYLIAGLTHGDWPGLHTIVLVPAFVFQTLFNLGLSLLIAQLVVPFRDIGNIMGHLSRIWMYLSPVIYPLDERLKNAPAAIVNILHFNPLAAILGLYRTALLDRPTEAYHWWGSAGWAVLMVVIGGVTFARMEHKLPRYLS